RPVANPRARRTAPSGSVTGRRDSVRLRDLAWRVRRHVAAVASRVRHPQHSDLRQAGSAGSCQLRRGPGGGSSPHGAHGPGDVGTAAPRQDRVLGGQERAREQRRVVAQMSLQLHSLTKSYGATVAVAAVDLTIERGRTLALLGPSGCGKSTLLRLIAGLERPDSGSLTMANADITDLPAQKRAFGVVFQDFALFPHLNVARNVGFGLVEQRRERSAI